LVLAHGFTQTGRSWAGFGRLLGRSRQLVAVDLPGHGGSADVRADVGAAGRLLVEAAGDGGEFDLLGYSLGARLALHAALERPAGLRRLVLIGGTGGIEDPAGREERRRRDEALADTLDDGDLDGFLARWLALPMFADLADPGLEARRANTAAGLASSLRLAGTGTQIPVWDRLGELACPVLAVAGAGDHRFAAHAGRIAASAKAGVHSLVPGARHAAHLSQPGLSAAIVEQFLSRPA
jgi:2-succinyl-6-hydroxy-2,4-cyclohexadiene-1-carboxylate synthase